MSIYPKRCIDCDFTFPNKCAEHTIADKMSESFFGGGTLTFHTTIQPYKCPVCNGSALVSFPPGVAGDHEFVSTTTGPWTCPACDKGIIWK